jgi:two-component system LytT family response regulator
MTALIVDDEISGVKALQILLAEYCPELTVSGVAHSADMAEELIQKLEPDILFLDIQMPFATGFDLLKRLKTHSFHLIFTTAYNQHAIEAFKHNAVDYLLKPIDPDDLISAVNKCVEKGKTNKMGEQDLEALLTSIRQSKPIKKLAVNTMEGVIFVDITQIIRLAADSNYTNIFLANGKKILSSKTLGEYEKALVNMSFFRVHNTHLINLAFVESYKKGEGGYVVMSDTSVVDVSRNKKKELFSLLAISNEDIL